MALTINPVVEVALIYATPGILSAILGYLNHRKLDTQGDQLGRVEHKTDGAMSLLKEQRDKATTRADFSEGRQEGVDSVNKERG